MTLEKRARELAWRIKGYPNRCAICSFQLAESADKGCVIGNCSYRPHDGSAEDGRVSRNRAELAEIQGIIAAALAAEGQEASQQVELTEERAQNLARSYLYGAMGYLGISELKDEAVKSVASRLRADFNAAAPSLHKEGDEREG